MNPKQWKASGRDLILSEQTEDHMNRKTIWIVILLASLTAVIFILAGGLNPRISFKPGCGVKEAHHYYGDDTRCHCLVVAGLFDSSEQDLPVDRIVELDNVTGSQCSVIFRSNGQYLVVDGYPLNNLKYNRIAVLSETESKILSKTKGVIFLSGMLFLIISVIRLAVLGAKERKDH